MHIVSPCADPVKIVASTIILCKALAISLVPVVVKFEIL